jgi:hypothetical protein
MTDADEQQPRPGALDVVATAPPDRAEPEDLFAKEERPVRRLVLVVMVEEDAADLIAALEAEGIGARIGDRTDDGGVEILIHDLRLAEAQAVLVEYTGDPSLVDYVVPESDADDERDGDPDDDATANGGEHDPEALVQVVRVPASEAARHAERLRNAGIDVRLEFPTPDSLDAGPATPASVLVATQDLDAARAVLNITF